MNLPWNHHLLVLGLVLALGTGLLLGILALKRSERRRKVWVAAEPDKPWRWDGEWRSGVIRSASWIEFVSIGIMAVVWNALSAPALFAFSRGVREGSMAPDIWLPLAFPVAGLGLIVFALYLYRRWRKYGACSFRMESVPGVIGGRLAGVVHVPVRVRPEDGYTLELTCVSHTAVRTGGRGESGLRNVEDLVWRKVLGLRRELLQEDSRQTALPVLFHIPFGLPSTGRSASNSTIYWRLEVGATTPGVDFLARFVVPVFVTPQSSASAVPDESSIADYVKPPDIAKAYARQRISRKFPSEGSVVFHLGPARRLGDAFGLTVLFLIWTAALIVLVVQESPAVVVLFIGATDLFLAVCLVKLWFRSHRVEASRDGLRVSTRYLGIGRNHRLSAKDIADIRIVSAGASGKTPYYAVKAKCRVKGKKRRSMLLAAGVAEEEMAEAMRADLLTALGRRA